MAIAAGVMAYLSSACVTVDNEPDPGAVLELGETTFRCGVEPILVRDCSYQACHGREGMALRVYSIGKLRAGPADTLDERIAPLTEAEHHANFLSATAFDFGGVAADDNLLIRKVLPAADGGYAHKGGALFTGPGDARAQSLRNWLNGQNPCSAASEAP